MHRLFVLSFASGEALKEPALTLAVPKKETDRFSERPARISLGKLQCFGLYHGLPGTRFRFRRNTTLGWSPDYNTAPVRPVDAAGFTKGIT